MAHFVRLKSGHLGSNYIAREKQILHCFQRFGRRRLSALINAGCAIYCILTGAFLYRKLPAMQWTEPQIEEISLGCEINSYACAEI
jgi:coenzyme PQQ precursor peptide PqqA